MRPIQIHLLAHFRPSRHGLSHRIPRAPHLEGVFHWWSDRSNLVRGVPFPTPQPDLVLTTDASLAGWGATLGTASLAHPWEAAVRGWHINALELLAVLRALQGFSQLVRGKSVLVRTDNTTTVAYINRQGGTHSFRLWAISWEMFQWCRSSGVTLKASHLPGVDNVAADALSRVFLGHSEWSLHPPVLTAVFQARWTPTMDLFASHLNHQLPQFCARMPVPGAQSVDALSLDWAFLDGYAFPPFALVNRVLEKAGADGCRLLLVAPFWPSQAWFPRLLTLLSDYPLVLPVQRNLLTHPPGCNPHPHPEVLHLTAWTLSGQPSERRAFRRRLPRWRLGAGDPPLDGCILQDSECSENGAVVARFLRLRRLSLPLQNS